jgi:hypothetical protein
MEVKIIRGSRKETPVQPFSRPEQRRKEVSSEPNIDMKKTEGPGLFSRLGHAAVKGLELPGEFVNQIAMLLGEPSFMKKRLSQDIQGYLGATPEQLEPQGTVEKYAQRVLTQAPTAALTGGLGGIARTAASAVPAVAAGEAGAPEWAQDLIQLGTDIGIGVRGGLIKSPSIKSAQKAAYDTARSLVSDAERPGAQSVIEGLSKAGRALETETDPKTVKLIEHVIDTVKKNYSPIFKPRAKGFVAGLNPKKAMDLRKSLNRLVSKNNSILEYTKPITEGLNNLLAQYGAENPAFFSSLTRADKLTAARNMTSFLEKSIKSIPVLGSKGKIGDFVGKIAGNAERIAKGLMFSPEARNIYSETIKSISSGSAAPIIERNLLNLDNFFESEPSISTSRTPEKRFKIIKGTVKR